MAASLRLGLTVLLAAAAFIAPISTVQADPPRGRMLYCPTPKANPAEQCYIDAGNDKARLSACDRKFNQGGIDREPARPTPRPQCYEVQQTPALIDRCYAWAGEDEEKLEACDQLDNRKLLIPLAPIKG
jgi:hypothetical protein